MSKSIEHTYVSFYLFCDIESPTSIAHTLRSNLHEEDFRGTIYLATEGINGQFSIPSSKLSIFKAIVVNGHPSFESIDFNMGDSYLEGHSDEDVLTFKKLSVKVREFILTDGLPKETEIDWEEKRTELTGEQWHNEVKKIGPASNETILLDCRNSYESELGTFMNATPLNTEVFSQTFEKLEHLLEDKPKNARILTFCTGGIRCVKVNAYLSQHLGFKNVASLKHGIVGYKRWLDECKNKPSNDVVKSIFKGNNYVFDRRRVQMMSSEPDLQTEL